MNDAPGSIVEAGTPPLAPVEWFLADGVKGSGDKPAWYKGDKYKSVAAQAEGYAQLEPKLGELTARLKGHAGAPEAYELKFPEGFALPEGIEWVPDPEHPLAKAALDLGKKHGLTQGVISDLYAAFAQSELANQPDLQEELSKFDADEGRRGTRIKAITDYLRANLDEQGYGSAVETIGASAQTLSLVEKLIGLQKPPKAAVPDQAQATRKEQEARFQAMQFEKDATGNRRIATDPAFRKEWETLGSQLYPGEHKEVVGLPSR